MSEPTPVERPRSLAVLSETAPVELLRSLAVLSEPPDESLSGVVAALGLGTVPTPSAYSDLFLFQLYPYASVHLGGEGMMGGDARERAAGFWRALGCTPPAEPDHLAALLGLYAGLVEEESRLEGAESALRRQSRRALLEEHLTPWVFAFLDRVAELDTGFYAEWAALLSGALRGEWERVVGTPTDALPLHLRMAPGLPDPRVEGAADFLSGMLAPVRSGVILTRSDLAGIAAEHDLALRAGERRYALENLLAQDAAAVLAALSTEVRRQRERHRARAPWLGASAHFAVERCSRTLALLEALARDMSPREATIA